MQYLILTDHETGKRFGCAVASFGVDDVAVWVHAVGGESYYVRETFDEIAQHLQALHLLDPKEAEARAPKSEVGPLVGPGWSGTWSNPPAVNQEWRPGDRFRLLVGENETSIDRAVPGMLGTIISISGGLIVAEIDGLSSGWWLRTEQIQRP